jgi:hypothetical protein
LHSELVTVVRPHGRAIVCISLVILAADSFNAMTTDRPYRRAMSVEVPSPTG